MKPLAEYSRGLNHSNLILTAQAEEGRAQNDCVEMFHYNDLPSFLSMWTQQKDGIRQYCYNITSKRSLQQLLEYKILDDKLLLYLFNSFDQACTQAEDYLLTENDILLDPEMIFLESESEKVWYCYLPGYYAGNHKDSCQQFQEFMEYLLQHLDHKNEQAVQLAYSVYQAVTEEQVAFHEVLIRIREGRFEHVFAQKHTTTTGSGQKPDEIQISKPVSSQKEVLKDKQIRGQIHNPSIQKCKKIETEQEKRDGSTELTRLKQKETSKKQAAEKLKNLLRKKIYTNSYLNQEEESIFEEHTNTEEMEEIRPTVCMAAVDQEVQNQFIYQGVDRTRDFHCIEGKMILGSKQEECDICIPFPMVSRVHARVEVNEQGVFLEDMNSTNGTQINGELLKYREKYKLNKGDIVSLAGENYCFH